MPIDVNEASLSESQKAMAARIDALYVAAMPIIKDLRDGDFDQRQVSLAHTALESMMLRLGSAIVGRVTCYRYDEAEG